MDRDTFIRTLLGDAIRTRFVCITLVQLFAF